MSLSRRQFLRTASAASLALGAAGWLAACGGDDDSDDADDDRAATTTPIDVQKLSAMMPFTLYLAFISDVAGKTGGYFQKAGIDLDLQFARSAPQALQQLAAGNVAVIRNAPLGPVKANANEGGDFVTIAMANQTILYVLVSSADEPYGTLQSLVGKTVGMATLAGNAEDTLNLVLRAKGIDPESVKRVAVGNEAASLEFIEQGRVDVVFATREAAASMVAKGLKPNVAEVPDANPLLGTGIVTTRHNLTTKRDLLVRYLRGLEDAMVAVRDQTRIDALLTEVRKEWDLPQLDQPAEAKPVIKAITDVWVAAGEKNLLRNVPERWASGIAEFERLKVISAGSKPTSFYTNELIDEAKG